VAGWGAGAHGTATAQHADRSATKGPSVTQDLPDPRELP
jgi:hypothetical protein